MTDWQISDIYDYILRPGLDFENSNLAECDIDKDKLGVTQKCWEGEILEELGKM